MTIKIGTNKIEVTREYGEARASNESHLLHKLKVALNKVNKPSHAHELIKARMHKDGHMYGNDDTQYLVQRNRRKVDNPIMIYDGDYAIRDAAKAFNAGETVTCTKEGEFPR